MSWSSSWSRGATLLLIGLPAAGSWRLSEEPPLSALGLNRLCDFRGACLWSSQIKILSTASGRSKTARSLMPYVGTDSRHMTDPAFCNVLNRSLVACNALNCLAI